MVSITIDYTPAVHQTAGIGRLTREVVRALLTIPSQHRYTLFCMGRVQRTEDALSSVPRPPSPAFRIAPLTDRWFHRLWFRAQVPLPVDVFAGTPDLYHATDFILPPTFARKTVLTVHDLTFERDPDSAVPTLLRFLKRVVPASARKATHLVADSHATADDLVSLYGLPRERITVIHSGVDKRFFAGGQDRAQDTARVRATYALGNDPFVLTVGTLQKRKNHLGLVRAFAQLLGRTDRPVNLVISGGKGWLYDEVLAEVTRLGLDARVKFIGFTADADLPALYRAADVFAFPSLYEGFGIPPLEAMASGVPVVTSNVSSLPEVVGDAALSVNPRDTAALAAALERALTDSAWRAEASARGIARARTFTWEKAGRELLAVYDRVLTGQ